MDAIQNPAGLSWVSGQKVRLKEYFDEYRDAVMKTMEPVTTASCHQNCLSKSDLMNLLMANTAPGEPREEEKLRKTRFQKLFREIETLCSPENLSIPGEAPPMQLSAGHQDKWPKFKPVPIPRAGLESLKSLEMQQRRLDDENDVGGGGEESGSKKLIKKTGIKRYPRNWFECEPVRVPGVVFKATTVDHEVLLAVKVYRPISKDKAVKSTAVQEIYCLGSNLLSDLRDMIKCPFGLATTDDLSDRPPFTRGSTHDDDGDDHGHRSSPDRGLSPVGRSAQSSGFIYIEGCFYNDTRSPENLDYSRVIREWAEPAKRSIGPFRTAKMEETRLIDLEVRLGLPYVYVHQGNHEHLLAFTEARLLSADDVQNVSRYPFERVATTVRSRNCMVCSMNIAKWVTIDNERVPEDPCFFCDGCFRGFNYDRTTGAKIGHFKAYQYVDINAI